MSEVRQLQEVLARFAEQRDWGRFHTAKNLSMALAAEAGEVLAETQWLKDEEIREGLKGALRERLADELADVLIYLLRLADICDIDIVSAAHAKVERNERRYPAEFAKGNVQKYTALGGNRSVEPESL